MDTIRKCDSRRLSKLSAAQAILDAGLENIFIETIQVHGFVTKEMFRIASSSKKLVDKGLLQ